MSTGSWTVIQDYSFRPVWSWTPDGRRSRRLLLASLGACTRLDECLRYLGFTRAIHNRPLTGVDRVAHIRRLVSVAPGATITWTAAAHGGMLRLEYQFIKYSSARARWEIVRDWSPDPVWAQMTTPLDEGDNLVIVAVKSWGGDNLEAVQEAHAVVQPPDESYVLATRPPSEELPRGQQVLFNSRTHGSVEAVASDDLDITAGRALPDTYLSASMRGPDGGVPGVGLYENAEWRYADSVARIPALDLYMTTVGPCATRVTRKFRVFELEYDGGRTAARVAADMEQVCADARATIFVAVRINSTLPLFNMFPVTSNAPSTVGPGTSVTWTADASSGTGPVEYRFLLYSAQENAWTMVRDWSTDRRFTWTPSTSDYGSHLVEVWARTVGSAVAYEDWRSSDPGRRHSQRATGVRSVLGCRTPQSRTAGHARGCRRWRIWSARISLRPVRVRDRSMVRDPSSTPRRTAWCGRRPRDRAASTPSRCGCARSDPWLTTRRGLAPRSRSSRRGCSSSLVVPAIP